MIVGNETGGKIVDQETGEVYEIIVQKDDGSLAVAKQACDMIEGFEREMKEIKKQYEAYKQALKDAMEEYGIEKIDTPNFLVSYVGPHERISLDSKAVEAKYPDVYRECMKVSDVKSSVRVRLR